MADIRTTPEAPPAPTHATVRREDYRPPDWLVPEVRLDFEQFVRARLAEAWEGAA